MLFRRLLLTWTDVCGQGCASCACISEAQLMRWEFKACLVLKAREASFHMSGMMHLIWLSNLWYTRQMISVAYSRRSEIAAQIGQAVQELLDEPLQFDEEEPLMTAGVSSMLAVQLTSRLEGIFGTELPGEQAPLTHQHGASEHAPSS